MDIATLEDVVRVHARERPDAPMMTFDGRTFTYAQVDERSNRVANGLRARGIGPEWRVAILAKSGPAVFDTMFGLRKLGAVQVALNWRLAADELDFIVADAGATLLFVDRAFVDVARAMPHVTATIVLDDEYEAWLAEQSPEDPGHRSGPEDVALQLYTSGTTGRPKGAMLANRSVFTFVDAAREAFPHEHGVHVICVPLFHVGGINWSMQALAQGGHIVAFREFDPDVLIAEVEKRRATHMMSVPAVLQLLLARPAAKSADFSSLEGIIYGGSSISEKLLREAIATFGHVLHGMYGSTELSFGATLLTPPEHVDPAHPEQLRSAGRPFGAAQIRVVDPTTSRDVAEGETGEFWFLTRQRGLGYWQRPEATAETFRADGWYRSGDLGHQIGGYVYLTDRLNDMIISGAENVYPAEIERVLGEHPQVSEVAAFGLPDEKWGEVPHAVIVRSGDIGEDELLAYAAERLAKYKRPRSITFAESLPRNASGKIQRRLLREARARG